MDDNRTLDKLAHMAITDVLFSATGNDDVEEDDEGGEQDFGNAPSIDQINDVVDNIHREDDCEADSYIFFHGRLLHKLFRSRQA